MFARENKLTAWHLGVAMIALFIGGFFGPLQKLEYVGVNLYSTLNKIGIASYYQGLTLHAVLNALVWTTFFIVGFFTFTITRSLNKELTMPKLNAVGLITMIIGLIMAAIPILMNLATVLFTFYPPMKANPFFYIGLVLVVVGSWICGWGFYLTYFAWRKENPGVQTPIIALGSLITMVLWQIATLGVATELLVMVIPWSFGLVEGIDPQLARTFFWFTGHPLVYFWLLPAYVSWYGMMPKQAGGKLFSEPLARLVFWLFLALSVPVGLHHQYLDPGVPAGWKFLHGLLTYSLFLPSMLTAFNVVASLEIGGRNNGGTGLLGWVRALPWGDPSYAAQNLAMILFVFGGIGGLTNSSYNLNLVIHNTSWVPGHFHLTVGSAVTLTFFGILYWLVPKLSGKPLWNRKVALVQAWTWFAGMLLMGNGLHILGLNFGVPRRTMVGVAAYASDAWNPMLIEAAIGGIILGISGLLFYSNMIGTVLSKKRLEAPIEMPVAEAYDEHPAPAWLDNWKPWLAITVVLIVVAYGPILFDMIANANMTSPGFKVW
ncbi:MAG: cbb3-type cytochrome c oxidase subunit I [Chloroflexi bacterium]|nr:cbb3-type cytochrome c oxidase subunit I [Chloroflexota bacterium]MBK6708737.1 cbb3-type cytochrome c oxidase subunit I [Chloroflexota bacterium]MBK7179315.1 cbb3-type cytochrome c oxidase subunit I [Chloroflexota bacterium]MBK7917097.1 cbb3-type cytochrome c oxidase subunit I [Chloroflexota bacterium]MBK8934315.1 cbb3-type cytochrome c oxidase subunit I [Chloroflexota bacterium]